MVLSFGSSVHKKTIIKGLSLSFMLIAVLISFSSCSQQATHDDEDEHHHDHPEGALVIEPEDAEELGIEFEAVKPGEFVEVIKVSGIIEPAATDLYTVTAKRSGIVSLAKNISEGVEIKKGATLASVSASGMEGGDVNAMAKVSRDAAKKEYERISALYKEGLATQAQLNAAEREYHEAEALHSTGPSGRSTTDTSPIDGVISGLYVADGQFVEAGTPIATVSRNQSLVLRAEVPGRFIDFLPSVASANFRPDYSDEIFELSQLDGKKISSGIEAPQNGYYPVRFSFLSNGRIRPGSLCEVYLTGNQKGNVISIPKEGLIEMQGNKYAYVVNEGEIYEKRLVKTGMSDGNRFEILSGIAPSDTVVTKGASVVRMAETSAVAPPQHNHNH